jgi:RNA polymerase sigma-70 factor (ECF subfamily)
MFARQAEHARPGRVDGAPAILVETGGRLVSVLSFTIIGGTVSTIDIIADPERLAPLRIEAS